jgi:hypothetical protein
VRQKLLFILFLAFILRLSVLFLGYHGDLNNQISWGNLAVERGLNGFYEGTDWPNSSPNQPPLTILFLAAVAGLWQLIHSFSWYLNDHVSFFPSSFIWFWEARGMILMMKLPSIFADLGIGWIISTYFKNQESRIKNKGRKALLVAGVWLFNPLVWYNSSVWGQTDSIVNLLGLLAVFSLLNKNLRWTAFWFTLSILFKGSLTYFAPILLFVALLQKHSIKEWLISIAYCLVPIAFVSIWFHPSIDLPTWFYNLYTNRFLPGEIGDLSANAFNFWYLVDPGKTLDSTIYFGLPARIWGFVPVAGVMIWQLIELKKGITDKKVFFALAITAFTVFLFMTRIHERYLYPFFPYATLLLGFTPLLWFVYIPISIIHLLNLYNLFWVPSIPFIESLLKNQMVIQLSSVVLIICWVLLLVPQFTKKLYNT